MQGITLLLMFQHSGIGGAELSLIECSAETLAGLFHLLVYLLVILM